MSLTTSVPLHLKLITLHAVRSKSLKLEKQSPSNEAKMAGSEGIQTIVNQVVVQAVTGGMMALRMQI